MWLVTCRIRGDGNSLGWQSPEFLLVNLGILMASFYKHCHWQWPSDIRSMRVRCSHGSEAPLVLVSPYLEILDSDRKVSCSLLIQQGHLPRDSIVVHWINDLWWNLLQGLLACKNLDRCIADSPENLLKETYPYEKYHKGDITLVTLGSVLARFFCVEEELFF